MNNFAKAIEEDRRSQILQILAASSGYRANQFLIQSALDSFGYVVSLDRVKADIAWLVEQDLVSADSTAGIQVPKLTGRGLDVAQGRVDHPGVQRPRPD